MKSRTKARYAALQALYEFDLTLHPLGQTLEARAEEQGLDAALYHFAQELVSGVAGSAEVLDTAIAQYAPEWPMDQVAVIDRNILRLALWEVAVYKKTPLKVCINEAVELAKAFGTDSSPRFINGVLGSLAENMDKVANAIIRA